MVIYSDASGQHGHLGAVAVILNQHQGVAESRQVCVGSMTHWTVHLAELIGIFYAISLAYKVTRQRQGSLATDQRPATILCNSTSALRAIRNPANKSGQWVMYAILQAAREMKARGLPLRLQWVPGHCDNPGNDTADQLAKETIGPNGAHPFHRPLSRGKRMIQDQIRKQWEQEWKSSKKGGHLRQIDTALPSVHTRWMYGSLPWNRAYLLTQLRTGHSWLAAHGKLHQFREDEECKCGAKETVVHVLVDCPRLKELRQELRKKVGDAFNNISCMLGGRGQEVKEGRLGSSAQESTIGAVLDFAEASQRFHSRAPRGRKTQHPAHRPPQALTRLQIRRDVVEHCK